MTGYILIGVGAAVFALGMWIGRLSVDDYRNMPAARRRERIQMVLGVIGAGIAAWGGVLQNAGWWRYVSAVGAALIVAWMVRQAYRFEQDSRRRDNARLQRVFSELTNGTYTGGLVQEMLDYNGLTLAELRGGIVKFGRGDLRALSVLGPLDRIPPMDGPGT